METNLPFLPTEIIHHILNFLDQGEFVQCAMISKEIKNFVLSTKRTLFVDGKSAKIIGRFLNAKFSVTIRTHVTKTQKLVLSQFAERISYFETVHFRIYANLDELLKKTINLVGLNIPVFKILSCEVLSNLTSLKKFTCRSGFCNISRLLSLTSLEELTVGKIISPEKLSLLPKLKKLKIRAIQDCEGFDDIFKKLELEELIVDFSYVETTDELSREYRQATEIFLGENSSVRFTGKYLPEFKNLKSLASGSYVIYGKYLKNLNLTKLDLWAPNLSWNVTDRDIEYMTSLKSLKTNILTITKSPSTKLTTLILGSNNFLSSSLRPLTSLTNLTLSGSHIKGEDLKNLTNLKELTLCGCEGVELSDLVHLKINKIIQK